MKPAPLFAALLLAVAAQAADKAHWFEAPYYPLSKSVPAALSNLPAFGRIDWTLERLPFATPGPQGGVSGMAFTALDGSLYMAGGYIPEGDETPDRASRETSRWAWRYTPATRTWAKLPDLPARREYPSGLAAGGWYYVLGGGVQNRGVSTHWQVCADCFRLDTTKMRATWQDCPKLHTPRSHMAAAAVGRYLVAIGGAEYTWTMKDPYQRRGNTEVLDLDHPSAGWQQRKPLPGPGRAWTASASCAGKLWMVGGISPEPDPKALTDTLAYDPARDEWSRKAALPMGGHSWGAACYQDRYVIVVGGLVGYGKDQVWSDLAFAYDIRDDRWMKVENTIPGGAVMSDVGVGIVRDSIYAAGAEGPRGTHFDLLRVGRIRRLQ